ncbi:MAG: hypothetical protein VYC56_07720 [Actinomycetota bacterium]|nr:hypothetical protein [Actinomycetota bacterium]MEC9424254.1 hypothetical protein [Actinomycetota bacterium]MEE2957743.1 hypothetical protein [Actinomycetota bacterium]
MLQTIGAIVLMYAVVMAAGIWATRKSRALKAAAKLENQKNF